MLPLASAVAVAVTTAGALAATGDLTPVGCIDDNDSGTDACAGSTDGLNHAASVAVSADGRSVYAASFFDDAIARFDRDTVSGGLTPASCIDDNDTGADDCVASADGLEATNSVAVSADGRSVYTASTDDDAIARFDRDTTTGALSPLGCIDDNDSGTDTCAGSADGLDGASSVAVSADGSSVYVASVDDDAIARFDRNTTNGALTPAGCIDDNDTGADACAGSADGLRGAYSVAVSADGRSVYAAAADDDAIARFDRDATTGALTPAGCIDDNDTGVDTCAGSTDGLNGVSTVAATADGRSVYAASESDDAIVRFDRDPATGALSAAGCIDDNDTGADTCAASTDALDGAASVAASAGGGSVYAAALADDAIVRFDRDASGALTPTGCIDDNDTGTDTCAGSADGLGGALSVAVSADGRSAYAASSSDDAIARFDREPEPTATDTDPPETTIDKGPKKKTEKRKAKLKFSSDESGSSFECKLDKKRFKPCTSPFKKKVKAGKRHKFSVRATDAAGNVDPTPAKRKWKVLG